MFSVEIIDCENGYIVLDGNSISIGQPYTYTRKKWVCETPDDGIHKMLKVNIEMLKLDR